MSGGPQRRFIVAINAEALALAWARREGAPSGAVVVVEREISPRGRLGRLWPHPPERTAVLATVWRPSLDVDHGDIVWLSASLGLLAAAESLVGGRSRGLGLWWPDALVDADHRRVGEVRAEVQLGPGRVASAVVTARLDVQAFGGCDHEGAVAAMIAGLGAAADRLDADVGDVATAYGASLALTGRRVVVRLLPRGATRGAVGGIDTRGRLELVSATGFVERVGLDRLDRVEVVTPADG